MGRGTEPQCRRRADGGAGLRGVSDPALDGCLRIKGKRDLRTLTIQELGGTRKTVEAGVVAIRDMLPVVNKAIRVPAPASELMLALQCGGSDGYSGITANPALGIAADILIAEGGTAILSETPEIYGAEHLLIRRAERPEVGEKLAERIRWWENYTRRHDMEMNNNPSPATRRAA